MDGEIVKAKQCLRPRECLLASLQPATWNLQTSQTSITKRITLVQIAG